MEQQTDPQRVFYTSRRLQDILASDNLKDVFTRAVFEVSGRAT